MNSTAILPQAPFHFDVAEGPDNAKAYWIQTADSVRLRVAYWETGSVSNGTVFLFQGRTENIEKYGRTAEAMIEAGYNSFAIDWRGQGLSDRMTEDRMTGHVNHYSDYQKDVAAMLDAANSLNLPKPWFLLGHSLGACVGLRALMGGFPVEACAFTAPLWGINISPLERIAAWPLAWAFQTLGFGHKYAPGTRGESYVLNTEFEDNRLTHDRDMYQYYINISEALVDQQIGGPSMGWLFQTLKETRSLSKLGSPTSTPCITFCGAEDTIVSIPAVETRMASWQGGTFLSVKDAKHDVLHEVPAIRSEVIGKICDLFASCPQRPAPNTIL